MATKIQNVQTYSHENSIGVTVIVACSMLSLVSVLGMFVILGVSAIQSRRSSDKTLFVRTQAAKYFVSLLICNLFQAIGGSLNIAWIVAGRVYTSRTCTTQAVIKQMGSIGAAIFTFVIGVHTFSLLFLRRKYSDRTCYITLFAAWAFLFLELSIENFVLAQQKEKQPFYGLAGYWCWITAMHPIERFTTSYLYMFVSALSSFILYSLVYFHLRDNISVSAGYKISFHRRPKVMAGRTSDGAHIQTDDRRVESHLTTLAKQMLWYPIAYIVIVLPMAASRFSTFSGSEVPFPVTVFTASWYMLHGFVNTVLFCTTRDILPGIWKQRIGHYTTWRTKRSDAHLTSQTNDTWFTATRNGTVGTATATVPVVRSVGVEKDVEIKYEAEPSISHIRFGSSTSLTPLPQPYGGNGQQANLHDYHIRRFSSSAPQDTRTTVCFEVDEGDEDSILSIGRHSATNSRKDEWEVSQHAGRASGGLEGGVHRPAPSSGAPSSIHPFATTLPAITNALPYHVRNNHQSPSPFLGNWRFWRRR